MNVLIYGLAGVGALVLIVIALGGFWAWWDERALRRQQQSYNIRIKLFENTYVKPTRWEAHLEGVRSGVSLGRGLTADAAVKDAFARIHHELQSRSAREVLWLRLGP